MITSYMSISIPSQISFRRPNVIYADLARLLAALVQFNHVAIRIAHEDSLRPGPEADGAAAQRDTGRLEPLLRGHDVGAQEGEVRDAGMLVGDVHEDVRFVRARGVEHQIEFHSGRVIED